MNLATALLFFFFGGLGSFVGSVLYGNWKIRRRSNDAS